MGGCEGLGDVGWGPKMAKRAKKSGGENKPS